MSRRCSFSSAQKIIDLLFTESSGDALLLLNSVGKNYEIQGKKKSTEHPSKKNSRFSRKVISNESLSKFIDNCEKIIKLTRATDDNRPKKHYRKISPEIIVFIHLPENRSDSRTEILSKIKESFGINISVTSIYEIWSMPIDRVYEMAMSIK